MTVQQNGCTSLYLAHDRPYVEVDLTTKSGNSRKARFLVSTGGSALVFTKRVGQDLGLLIDEDLYAQAGEHIFRRIQTPHMAIAGYHLNLGQTTAWMAPDPYIFHPGDDVDGVLPGFVLSRHTVTLNYTQQEINISSADNCSRRGEPVSFSLHSSGRFPCIEVTIAGERYRLLLDTGTSCSLFSQALLDEWTLDFPGWPHSLSPVGTANMGMPGEEHATMVRIPRMMIGSILLQNVSAVSRATGTFEHSLSEQVGTPIVGVLAGNVLRQFSIELDYQHNISYWEWSVDSYPYDMDMIGLTLFPHMDGTYSIIAVSECNHCYVRQAINVGDRLVQVDSLMVTGLPLARVVDALKGSPGQKYTLLLERDGELRCVSVATARIL